jgi:glycosyltransferase involved in cell wall biosynthesis
MDASLRPVAFCVSSLRMGGGERVTIDLANGFAKGNRPVHLVTLKTIGEFKDQLDPRVKIVSLDARRFLLSLPAFMRYLRRERPEALLATDEFAQLLALFARSFSGVDTRIVLRSGTMLSELFKRQRGLRKLYWPPLIKSWYRRADGFVAVSEGIADDLETALDVPRERISVVYQPKDAEAIRVRGQEPVGHAWLADSSVPVLLSTGRLREQKNFPLLIKAVARVAERMPVRLIILGKGRDESMLRALIKEKGAEGYVELAGYIENPYAYMARSSLFVFTSLWEGMPNSMLEAMACGLPVISSDCRSGPREILAPATPYRNILASGSEQAEYGVLFALNDEEALVKEVEALLTDEALRTRYAQKSLERVKDFAIEVIFPQYARALGI